MKKILLFIIIFFISYTTFSQYSLSGKITDQKNGEALVGATIYIPHLSKGTISDENGHYTITNIPQGNFKIQFSYVGYKTRFEHVSFQSSINNKLDIQLESSIIHTQEVVVSGGTYSTQHENAIKIESISAAEINQAGDASFMKNIAEIPGISVISKGPGVSKPVIRGLSMTNILLLNNGIRMENFQFSENHPFIVNEFGIDKVEVIKGPASLLYGSDAIGGVINLIKEKPAPVNQVMGDFNTQYHSNTNGFVSNLGVKGSNQQFFWGVRAGIKSHMDYFDGSGRRVPNTRFNEKSGHFFTGINKSFGSFRLFYDYNEMKSGMSIPASISLVNENHRETKVWYQDLNSHILSSKNTLFFNNFKTEINLSWQKNNRQLQTSESMPEFTMVDMDLQTISYELKTYINSSENFDLIGGFQGLNKRNQNNEAPNHVLPDFSVNDFSLFSLVKYRFGKQFYTQLGLRYDLRFIDIPEQGSTEHSHEEEHENEHLENEPNLAALHKSYDNASATLGGTYQLGDVLLRANFATAYRTPNIAELTQDGMHGARYEQGNRNLKSQRSYEADVSLHYHSGIATIDLAAFYNRINNYIFISPTNDTTASGDLIYRYMQNSADLAGVEAGFEIMPLNWLNMKATYAYLQGKQSNGNYLPFIPHNKITGCIKFSSDKLWFLNKPFVKTRVKYAFEQNKPAPFETTTSSYTIVDIYLGFDLKVKNQSLKFNFTANNILNTEFFDHLSTLKPLGYYNMGRNFSISMVVPFGVKR